MVQARLRVEAQPLSDRKNSVYKHSGFDQACRFTCLSIFILCCLSGMQTRGQLLQQEKWRIRRICVTNSA